MAKARDDNYTNVLLEDMRSDIKLILEIVVPTQKTVARLDEEVQEIRRIISEELLPLKAVTIDHSDTLKDHEIRIANLETA